MSVVRIDADTSTVTYEMNTLKNAVDGGPSCNEGAELPPGSLQICYDDERQ